MLTEVDFIKANYMVKGYWNWRQTCLISEALKPVSLKSIKERNLYCTNPLKYVNLESVVQNEKHLIKFQCVN